jgi:hypothetical protein
LHKAKREKKYYDNYNDIVIEDGVHLGVSSAIDEINNYDKKVIKLTEEERCNKIKKDLRLDHLDSNLQTEILDLACKYNKCFSIDFGEVGFGSYLYHIIDLLPDVTSVNVKQFKLPYSYIDIINKELTLLENNKNIFECESSFNAPIFLVKRKQEDGTFIYRLVGNYILLNKSTIPVDFKMDSVQDVLEKVKDSKYYSVFDVKQAFLRQLIYPPHCKYTAFTAPDGRKMAFLKSCFGLKNSPAYWTQLIRLITKD